MKKPISRGYCGIGIARTKTAANLGTLWRSADLLGASFIFTVGRRYQRQSSDTMKSWRHIPLFHFATVAELKDHGPYDCRIVGVELDERAHPIANYVHHERCIYLLGAEDSGLSRDELAICHDLVQLPGRYSMNVAVAGSLVLFDRLQKQAAAA